MSLGEARLLLRRSDDIGLVADYAMSLGEGRLLLRRSDDNGGAERRKPEQSRKRWEQLNHPALSGSNQTKETINHKQRNWISLFEAWIKPSLWPKRSRHSKR